MQGELLAIPRAAAHDARQLGIHHHVPERQPVDRDTGVSKCRSDLRARQLPAAAERPLHHSPAARDEAIIQPQLAVVGRVHPPDAWAGQLEHPVNVRGCHEMPGRPQDVRPEDVPLAERTLDILIGQSRDAQAERPLGGGVVLRLDGAHPRDNVRRMAESRSGKSVIVDSPPEEGDGRQRLAFSNASTSFDER